MFFRITQEEGYQKEQSENTNKENKFHARLNQLTFLFSPEANNGFLNYLGFLQESLF